MDPRAEIREFLTSRRAKITPEQAGLTSYGSRRVPGLRREEVAVLAGVSVPYYTRIERGDMNGVSGSVLEALARALELDEAERAHLFDLARALRPSSPPRRKRTRKRPVRPSVQHMLDAVTGAAAFVHNARLDNLATNELARALYFEMFRRGGGPGPVNSARYVFLDPGARDFYIDWGRAASDVVAILRSAAGRDPYDRELSDLVGELSTQSEEFRTRWAAHNVRFHDTGVKELHHPVVGESLSPTTAWSSTPIPDSRSRSTPPSPARSRRRRSACSEAGPQHSKQPCQRRCDRRAAGGHPARRRLAVHRHRPRLRAAARRGKPASPITGRRHPPPRAFSFPCRPGSRPGRCSAWSG